MKIATWNINSIRAREERLLNWLAASAPEVLCLQEIKCAEASYPDLALRGAGFQSAILGQKSYNGVAIIARTELTDVVQGMQDGYEDSQARLIAATVNGVRVICVYVPNGQALGSPAFEYKMQWLARLTAFLAREQEKHPRLVVCGDFNVAPEPEDTHDPAGWEGHIMFSEPERNAIKELYRLGLGDTLRKHHAGSGMFSWWDYRQLAFPRNRGLRIDYILATPPLLEECTAAGIDREARKGKEPSDHAPVWAEFGR